MTCNAPTSMHDGVDVKGYYHVAPRAYTVMCRGCATCLEGMGAGWKPDRRAANQHVHTDRRRTSTEAAVAGTLPPAASSDARRVPFRASGYGRLRHPA